MRRLLHCSGDGGSKCLYRRYVEDPPICSLSSAGYGIQILLHSERGIGGKDGDGKVQAEIAQYETLGLQMASCDKCGT